MKEGPMGPAKLAPRPEHGWKDADEALEVLEKHVASYFNDEAERNVAALEVVRSELLFLRRLANREGREIVLAAAAVADSCERPERASHDSAVRGAAERQLEHRVFELTRRLRDFLEPK